MSVQQALQQRCRSFGGALVLPVQPAPFGAGPSTPAQITMSPQTPTGEVTTGFQWFTTAPSTITIWKRDPASGIWAVLVPIANYVQFLWQTVQCNASALYFQKNAAAAVIFMEETSGVGCLCPPVVPPT